MREMLDEKLARYEELERQMTDSEVQADSSRMSAVAREHGSLRGLVNKYRGFRKVIDEDPEENFRSIPRKQRACQR